MWNASTLTDETVPVFCWDRDWTSAVIREKLQNSSPAQWLQLAGWIMREAPFRDVWVFLSPSQVQDRLSELQPFLGRKKDFWNYIIRTWHELGKI